MSVITIEIEINNVKFNINNKAKFRFFSMLRISLIGYLFLLTARIIAFLFESPISSDILLKSLYYIIPIDSLLIYLYSSDPYKIFFIVIPLITVGILIGAMSRNWILALSSTALLISLIIITRIIIGAICFGDINFIFRELTGSLVLNSIYVSGLITFFSVLGSLVK